MVAIHDIATTGLRQPFEVVPRDRTEGEGERLAPLYSTVIVPAMRGNAVGVFMTFMGVPADQLVGMRQYPMWPMWEAIAPTLAYDASVLGRDSSVPTARRWNW